MERAARANWRVFTLAELHDLGFSPKTIRTAVARGQLHPIHRGVYVYGHPDLAWQGEFLAAQHVGGPDAYVTWGSGLAMHRLWRPYTGKIHVASPTRHAIVLHHTATPPEPDELRHDGPLTYPALPRLLLEFTAGSNQKQLERLITKAVRQDKFDHAHMRTVLHRHRGAPGTLLLQAAYAGYLKEPRTKSELEKLFDRRRAERPWIPEPERNVYLEAGGIRWEIDRLWREFGVAVEIDGRNYHQALADRDKDELKRAKLATVGIQMLSISDWRLEYDVTDCLDDLEAILALHVDRAA